VTIQNPTLNSADDSTKAKLSEDGHPMNATGELLLFSFIALVGSLRSCVSMHVNGKRPQINVIGEQKRIVTVG